MEAKSLNFKDAATRQVEELARTLGADLSAGLSTAEADRRRAGAGSNEIARKKKTAWQILFRQVASPFIFLLFVAAAIAFATGEHVDAAMVVLFVAINTGLGFFQEYRAEKAVDVLMQFWQNKTHALRDGKVVFIATRELVPGDIVRLQAGDKIPADVRFVHANGVTVDESILTGESVNVSKDTAAQPSAPQDYYEATNIGFSGTALLTGEADGLVIATGAKAAVGEIATLTSETKTVSVFEKQISQFSLFILKLVVITLVFVFVLNVGLKGVDRIQELILFCIALTVGVIPEALPVVSTIAMSRGAMEMAKRKVIVKRLSAIDDLGSIDILCTDKTGTVTQNVLNVADVNAADKDACLRYALLGSSFIGESEKQPNNSFDVAIWKHVKQEVRRESAAIKKLGELPFDPVSRHNAVLVAEGASRTLIMRGSAEAVLPLCKDVPDQFALGKYLATQGLGGNRVIAVAVRRDVPEGMDLEEASQNLSFLGIIAFHDPLKPDAIAAAERAKVLGVQIKILTGDSKEVAGAVAHKMRLIEDPLKVMTGAEFDALDPEARHKAAHDYHVFARVNPKQKFGILAMLQEKYAVGFLGEGFNDAPGLKMANVGLAVEGASDIAKEAADVILLNKDLAVIFDGIEEGRRTYANTIKYLKVTLAGNFGNFYAVAVASLFIDFLPMLPLQILLVNLLTDVPMMTIAADTVDVDELQKPKRYDAKHIILYSTILGIVSSMFDFTTFAVFLHYGEASLQTMWLIVSTLTEIGLIFLLRTRKSFFKAARPPLSIIVLGIVTAAVTITIPFTNIGRNVFHLVRPEPKQLLIGLTIVIGYLVATETVKLWLTKTGRDSMSSSAA